MSSFNDEQQMVLDQDRDRIELEFLLDLKLRLFLTDTILEQRISNLQQSVSSIENYRRIDLDEYDD